MMTVCPSCQTQVDVSKSAGCPFCGWRFNAAVGARGLSIVRPATRPKIQCEVDLAIAVDRTGSSMRFQKGIPMTAGIILNQVSAKARTVKCWVQSHGDLDDGQEFVLHTDSGTPEQAIEDMKMISYGGGGDPKEHHLDGIENLLKTVPWTADLTRARGAILAFLTADTKPTKSGITPSQGGDEIKDRGVLLYLVCEPTPTLLKLAEAASGLMFQISNNPDHSELQRIAAQLAASIIATVASGDTVPMTITAVGQ
jgi:hypothetical protein